MNLKLVKRNNNTLDFEKIGELSQKLGLHIKLTELLFSRGIDTEDEIKKFLYPSKDNFYDPFLLKNMQDAVDRIEMAIENHETVVVFGDYDADGVCAAAILSLYLCSRGLSVITHIPNRLSEGYGLSIESLEKIIETSCPDLIITCDCGISGYDEVEFAKDLGVEVIVTDHHEVSDKIPDCIVVNPKLSDCKYPIDSLAGAGVALKVVHALGGIESAEQYLDIAAVATIADLVPLIDENRLIVQLGLSKIKNKGLSALIKNQQLVNANSGDITYKIAPRINAAGRMGDAYRAFELLTTSDNIEIKRLIDEINEDNNRRKELSDELYNEATLQIEKEDIITSRAIVLSHPEWEKGLTGILAARLAGDFHRPTFIMVSSGDTFKGTARSICDINIYELLTYSADLLEEYGGHSQAAGFAIKKSNIELFKARVDEYLTRFDDTVFLPELEYDLEINQNEIDFKLCKALEMIQPLGNTNSRPIFVTDATNLKVSTCKGNFNHSNITLESGLNVLAFNYYASNQFLMGDAQKKLALELSTSIFNGRESIRAILKGVIPSKLYINNQIAKAAYLYTLRHTFGNNEQAKFQTYDKSDIANVVGDNIFGTLVVSGSEESYNETLSLLNHKFAVNEFLFSTAKNNLSKIMVAPIFNDDLRLNNYNKIVFVDSPLSEQIISFLSSKTNAKIFAPKADNKRLFLDGIDVSRDEMVKYYEAIRRNSNIVAVNIFTYFKQLSLKAENLSMNQFIASYLIFSQLGIFNTAESTSSFSISINTGVKSDLQNSSIYRLIKGDE